MSERPTLTENEIDELYSIQQDIQLLVDRKVKRLLRHFLCDVLGEEGLSYFRIYENTEQTMGGTDVKSDATSFSDVLNSKKIETIIDFIQCGRLEDKPNAKKVLTELRKYTVEQGWEINYVVSALSNAVKDCRFVNESITIYSTEDAAEIIKRLRTFVSHLRNSYAELCSDYDNTEKIALLRMESYAKAHNEEPDKVFIEKEETVGGLSKQDSEELLNIQRKLSDLMDIPIKAIFERLLIEIYGDNLKTIVLQANQYIKEYDNGNRSPFNYVEGTVQELVAANAIDNLYNIIRFYRVDGTGNKVKSPAQYIKVEVFKYLKSNGVSLNNADDFTINIVRDNLSEVRNHNAHFDDVRRIRTATTAAERIAKLRKVVSIFRLIYPDNCKKYDLWESAVLDLIVDYADRHNEVLGDVFTKSNAGMISIKDLAEGLMNDQLQGMSPEAVSLLVYRAVVENNIEQRNARIVKSKMPIILDWIMREANISDEQREEIREQSENIKTEQEIVKAWLLNVSKISNQDMLNTLNESNLLIDYRFFENEIFYGALCSRILNLMSSNDYLFVADSFREYFQTVVNNPDSKCLKFVDENENRIQTLIAGNGFIGVDELSQIVLTHPDNQFAVLTMDESIATKLEEKYDNVTLLIVSSEKEDYTDEKAPEEAVTVETGPNVEIKPTALELNESVSNNQKHQKKKENSKPLFEKKKLDQYEKDVVNKVSYIPDVKEEVYTLEGERLLLNEQIGEGGEGRIFSVDDSSIVVKIYFENCNTKNRKEKIELMCSTPIDCDGICWPKKALYNANKEFVGYAMQKAQGVAFNDLIKLGKMLVAQGWTRKDMLDCMIKMMEMYDYLHRNNILVGDINDENILVESKDKIYFVDTDSYQFDKFPLQVQQPRFNDPLVKAEEGERLEYTINEERYKMAYITYAMLLIGDTPWAFRNGENGSIFKFTKKGSGERNKPTFSYIWSYMGWETKNLFLRVFDNDDRSVKASDWIDALKKYKRSIGDDEEANKVILTKYKDKNGLFETDMKCTSCGGYLNVTKEQYKRLVDTKGADKILCKDCAARLSYSSRKSRYMKCPTCGRVLSVSAAYLSRREEKGYTTKCYVCDTNRGAKGLYRVPSLAEVLDEME